MPQEAEIRVIANGHNTSEDVNYAMNIWIREARSMHGDQLNACMGDPERWNIWCGRVKRLICRAKPASTSNIEWALLHIVPFDVHDWATRYAITGLGGDRAR
jgi:hypothetical protein